MPLADLQIALGIDGHDAIRRASLRRRAELQ